MYSCTMAVPDPGGGGGAGARGLLQSMQPIFLAVLLPSLTKHPSNCQICRGGVLGFSEKQFFLIILIFNLDSHYTMLLSYTN